MSSKKRRWSGPVTITLWFISLIIWILYAAMYREPYCTYRFPVVDMTFFRITLVNLFVPSIPVIICGIFFFFKENACATVECNTIYHYTYPTCCMFCC